MLTYPNIDPVALQLGPLKVHWYGLMYLIGIAAGYWLGMYRAKKPNSGWTPEQVSDVAFYLAMGMILGGRMGYMLFYNFSALLENPLSMLQVWNGGMSFHGGFLGVCIAMLLLARKFNKAPFDVLDFIAPLVAIGLGAGRIGNFIGAELYGRVTTSWVGMIFPGGGPLPRHPSQLYQAFLEGVVLFAVVWWFTCKPRPRMAASGLFILLYGSFRILVEFFREPDAHIGFITAGWLTMGQLLSLPMVLTGCLLLFLAYRKSA